MRIGRENERNVLRMKGSEGKIENRRRGDEGKKRNELKMRGKRKIEGEMKERKKGVVGLCI